MMLPVAEQVEDFWWLLHNLAHWEFETFLMAIENVLFGLMLIPFGRRWLKKHDEKKHAHEHCNENGGKILVFGNWDPITNVFTPCDKAA